MVTLHCNHPDLKEFIELKKDNVTGTGMNISVKWTDEFMDAVENNEEWTLRWPVDEDPEDAEITKTVSAKEMFDLAADMAHGDIEEGYGGDPGCMYIDRMEDYSTGCNYPDVRVNTTNPCGEIGMQANDSCRLIALNLMSAVDDPFTDNASLNPERLEKLAYEQQVLLDNLVDLEIQAIDKIIDKVYNDPEDYKYKRIELDTWRALQDTARKYRRTGGGFTALGDMLASLGVEYGSKESQEIVDKAMRAKFKGEWNASIDLAIMRDPFPMWDPQYDNTEFFDMMEEEFPEIYERNMEHGRRNISLSTVAPTGSVSLLANYGDNTFGTTSGIEPLFATEENKFWHTRNKRADQEDEYDFIDDEGDKWKQYKVFHRGFEKWLEENKEEENFQELPEEELKELAEESPYVSSAGIEVENRLRLQSVVQQYTSHSLSSTLNFPSDATKEDILETQKLGYELGLKGVTVFRNGTKRGVLEDGSENQQSGRGEEITYHDAPERPDILECDVEVIDRGSQKWVIVIGLLNNKPYEVFVLDNPDWTLEEYLQQNQGDYGIKKLGSQDYRFVDKVVSDEVDEDITIDENILSYTPSSDVDVLTRFTSQLMRHGVKMDYIVEQVRKADITINDFSKILGDVLAQYTSEDYEMSCDNCGSNNVKFVEGCSTCQECGHSKCS